jgi:putative oxidoreductase
LKKAAARGLFCFRLFPDAIVNGWRLRRARRRCNRRQKRENTMDVDRIAARSQPYLLSLFRFITGLLLFQYGVAKLFKFPSIDMFADVTPLSLWGISGMIEFVLGGLLMLGLLTRLTAFILSGEMAFAYFIEHLPHSFFPLINNGTLAILMCFACLYLASAGGGPLSLDAMRRPAISRA